MTFQFRVADPMGNTHAGTLEAVNLEEATQQLRRDGFKILELDEDDGEGLLPKRISKSDIIYITCQLAIMVDTGITLAAALEGIVEQETNPTLRKVMADLNDAVAGGEDFSTALARHPKLFNKTYVSLVKASEATGTLGAMLDRIAAYLRKEVETQGKIRAAMAYPAVMMVLAVGVTIFLLTYILPKFTPLFESRGTKLPAPTLVMMTLSDAILGYWYLWVIGVTLLVIGFLWAKKTPPGRKILDWTKINLPIVGTMFRKVAISRSIRTMGTMLASGVPIIDSIRLAGEVAGNVYYEELWQHVLDEVTTGRRICEVLKGNPLFPRVLVQMIASGEETGKLDSVLERVSVYYDGEVETSLKATTSMIEPIMISVMGVVVGTIGLALLLPIFSLSKHP
ncbi:MAG TPA: type II secretion system F family protein [Thermoguttaceae bacterium]|nr:type II secretion system F family protein [Thermoguttaceae bacterium]